MFTFSFLDQRLFGFVRFLWQRMNVNRVLQVAGSLTFTTLLALVPLLTIGLIVISAFPMFADYSARFKLILLSTMLPEFAGKVLKVYMRQFADNAEKLTAVGVLMLGVTSLMLMATIERTFNAIWGVSRSRHWLHQAVIYWSVLTVGPVVLGGGLLLWHDLFRSWRLAHHDTLLLELVQSMGSVLLTAASLALLYRIVPNRFVPMRHAMWGALLTSILIECARLAFGFYIGAIASASYKLVYGAFASIPIVLLWMYCLWLLVLAGAVFTCALAYWQGGAWRRPLNARRRFLDALRLLIALDRAHRQGIALSPLALRAEIPVGYDELGWVLDRLAGEGYVQHGVDQGWVLMKALAGIRLSALFQLFVYTPELRCEDGFDQEIENLLQPTMASLHQLSVADIAGRLAAPGVLAGLH
jgi:membrane protein